MQFFFCCKRTVVCLKVCTCQDISCCEDVRKFLICIFRPLPGPEEIENVCCVYGGLYCVPLVCEPNMGENKCSRSTVLLNDISRIDMTPWFAPLVSSTRSHSQILAPAELGPDPYMGEMWSMECHVWISFPELCCMFFGNFVFKAIHRASHHHTLMLQRISSWVVTGDALFNFSGFPVFKRVGMFTPLAGQDGEAHTDVGWLRAGKSCKMKSNLNKWHHQLITYFSYL